MAIFLSSIRTYSTSSDIRKIQYSISTEKGQPLTENHSFITQYVLRATIFITVFTRSRINIDSSRQLYNDFGGKELFNIE